MSVLKQALVSNLVGLVVMGVAAAIAQGVKNHKYEERERRREEEERKYQEAQAREAQAEEEMVSIPGKVEYRIKVGGDTPAVIYACDWKSAAEMASKKALRHPFSSVTIERVGNDEKWEEQYIIQPKFGRIIEKADFEAA